LILSFFQSFSLSLLQFHLVYSIYQNINQSINSILYCASLYTRSRFTKSRVQLSFIHCHTGGGKLPPVATAALGQTDRSVAANQRQRPLRPPPTFIHIHSYSYSYQYSFI